MSDVNEEDNWKQLSLVRRFMGRDLTDAERDEVLKVGLNAGFFKAEKAARIADRDRQAG